MKSKVCSGFYIYSLLNAEYRVNSIFKSATLYIKGASRIGEQLDSVYVCK